MSIEKPKDERRALYDKFKEELAEGSDGNTFSDEDDLVIIYDQASDLRDEYVQLEVLLRGYKYFPDSDQLAARKALLYDSYNLTQGLSDTIADHKNSGNVIWRFLNLRLHRFDVDDTCAEIEKLLTTVDDIDDETVIQLVNLAAMQKEGIQWLKDKEALLRSKCSYTPTLLYEIYLVMEMYQEYDYAAKKIEELTEIEPFNIDFWITLAECYYTQAKMEQSLAAAEYALALDSENFNAVMAKAEASLSLGNDPHEVVDLLTPFVGTTQFTERALQVLGNSLLRLNRDADVVTLANKFLTEVDPWSRDAMEMIICLDTDDEKAKNRLTSYFHHTPENDELTWVEWAEDHYATGDYRVAALILECFDNESGLSQINRSMLSTSLYVTKRYADCADMLEQHLQSENRHKLTYEEIITGLLSMLRINRTERAIELLPQLNAIVRDMDISGIITVGVSLQAIGAINMLNIIETFLAQQNPEVTIDDIDPFPVMVKMADNGYNTPNT